MQTTEITADEIVFVKYEKMGAYHWRSYFGNIIQIDSYLRGIYNIVINSLKESGANANTKILDVGCGDGALSGLIYKRFKCKIYGIDQSPTGIQFCKKQFEKYGYKGNFEVSTGYTFNFEDETFDFVVFTEVIEHLQFPEKMLVEIKRVLKHGGKLILTTPIRSSEYVQDPMHVTEFYQDELVALCEPTFGKPVDKIYSHPMTWYELHTYGKKLMRSLIRFYVRIMDKVFGYNVFIHKSSLKNWRNYKQQALVLIKKMKCNDFRRSTVFVPLAIPSGYIHKA